VLAKGAALAYVGCIACEEYDTGAGTDGVAKLAALVYAGCTVEYDMGPGAAAVAKVAPLVYDGCTICGEYDTGAGKDEPVVNLAAGMDCATG
jgi:hypothetical protein